jgi:thymidine kinase
MNAGKSLEILKIANNYREQGKNVMIFTPAIDNRYGVGKVTSRIGISEDAYIVGEDTNIYEVVLKNKNVNCVLVDEAQFLTKEHVIDLTLIVDKLNIPVICYGLKNDFRNELFDGSKWLLVYADKIEEVKTVCWQCDRKATMILKIENGQLVYSGKQVDIGGNEKYMSVCRRHYYNPEL